MSYKTNILAFLQIETYHPLLESYHILIAIELALKDLGMQSGNTGHDIPSMLAQTAQQYPALAARLHAHQARLQTDLTQIICNHKNRHPVAVQQNNYPNVRYTRFAGDWNGVGETSAQSLTNLAQTCNSLLMELRAHKAILGIQI